MRTLSEIVGAAVKRATKEAGGPVTIGAILAVARPDEGYVDDYRRVALRVTDVAAYTLHGDPLRVLKSDASTPHGTPLGSLLEETS